MSNPCAHLFYGDGQGKTSAATGLCVRALGAGKTVMLCSFLKGGKSSEIVPLYKLGAEIRCCGGGKFVFQMNEDERAQLETRMAGFWAQILADAARYDVVALDEAVDAAALGLIPQKELLDFIENAECEIIVTGHEPFEGLTESCGYVTRTVGEAHPYNDGQSARFGIEY